MKWLLPLLLCFASALAQAQPRVERSTAVEEAAKQPPRAAELQRRQRASLSIFLTDDVDYLRLPAFASRTPPQPVRFIRVGVEWSF